MNTLSVCITTFNRWHSCLNALQSVCSQMQEGLEVILVDDCSTDPMPEKVNNFIHKNHVIYIRHQINQGLSSARNTAIQRASGKYFAFCDDDDAWSDGFASRLLALLESSPSEVAMAIALPSNRRQSWEKIFNDYPTLQKMICVGIVPPASSQVYQTQILKKIEGYNTQIKSGVDHDLWLSLAKLNPRVAVSWGNTPIVNKDPKSNRMTTVEEHRRSKINQALKIWEPKIVEVFGNDFYQHFYQCYQQHLDYSFFIQSLKKRELSKAFKRGLKNPSLIKRLVKLILQKPLSDKPCNSFPSY